MTQEIEDYARVTATVVDGSGEVTGVLLPMGQEYENVGERSVKPDNDERNQKYIFVKPATIVRDFSRTLEVLSVDIPDEPPAGSVVLDANGTAWQKQPDYTDRWVRCSTAEQFSTALKWAYLVAESRKLTVIYRAPEVA